MSEDYYDPHSPEWQLLVTAKSAESLAGTYGKEAEEYRRKADFQRIKVLQFRAAIQYLPEADPKKPDTPVHKLMQEVELAEKALVQMSDNADRHFSLSKREQDKAERFRAALAKLNEA